MASKRTTTADQSHTRAGARRKKSANGNGNGSSSIRSSSSNSEDAQIRAATSALLRRAEFASKNGLSFNGKRDLNRVLGYDDNLDILKYRARYRRGGIAKRLIEAYPRATWGGGFSIIENEDEEVDTEFENAWNSLHDRLNITSILQTADTQACLGHYAVVLIGTPDGNLNYEMPSLLGPDSIIYLTPIPEDRAQINSFIGFKPSEISDPRFGLPSTYHLQLGIPSSAQIYTDNSSGRSEGGFNYYPTHWSRVIHVAESGIDNNVYAEPKLQAVWNYLDDLAKGVGGQMEAIWRRADPGLQLAIDPAAPFGGKDDPESIELFDAIDDYVNNLSRIIPTRWVDIKPLNANLTNLNPSFEFLIDLICATFGYPKRIFLGTERGELASTQDRSNWADRIAERRQEFAVPLIRQFIDRLILFGALPKPINPKGYQVVWPTRDELTENEKADVMFKIAQANSFSVTAGSGLLMTGAEIRADILNKDELDPEDANPSIEEGNEDEPLPVQSALPVSASIDPISSHGSMLRSIADKHSGKLKSTILTAWKSAGGSISVKDIESKISSGDHVGLDGLAIGVLRQSKQNLSAYLPHRIKSIVVNAAQGALKSAKARGSWFVKNRRTKKSSMRSSADGLSSFDLSFTDSSPRAIEYAAIRSSELITEIIENVESSIREMIANGISEGLPPRVLAQQIYDTVGLRSDQITAVSNLIDEISAAQPGDLIERFLPSPGVRDISGFRAKVPTSGPTPEWTARQVSRYSEMQRNYRAETIARTETMRSANEGQRELWGEAQSQGLIPNNVGRIWIGTEDERERDEHWDMNDQVVGLNEPYDPPIEPGEEVNCRCTEGLVELE